MIVIVIVIVTVTVTVTVMQVCVCARGMTDSTALSPSLSRDDRDDRDGVQI